MWRRLPTAIAARSRQGAAALLTTSAGHGFRDDEVALQEQRLPQSVEGAGAAAVRSSSVRAVGAVTPVARLAAAPHLSGPSPPAATGSQQALAAAEVTWNVAMQVASLNSKLAVLGDSVDEGEPAQTPRPTPSRMLRRAVELFAVHLCAGHRELAEGVWAAWLEQIQAAPCEAGTQPIVLKRATQRYIVRKLLSTVGELKSIGDGVGLQYLQEHLHDAAARHSRATGDASGKYSHDGRWAPPVDLAALQASVGLAAVLPALPIAQLREVYIAVVVALVSLPDKRLSPVEKVVCVRQLASSPVCTRAADAPVASGGRVGVVPVEVQRAFLLSAAPASEGSMRSLLQRVAPELVELFVAPADYTPDMLMALPTAELRRTFHDEQWGHMWWWRCTGSAARAVDDLPAAAPASRNALLASLLLLRAQSGRRSKWRRYLAQRLDRTKREPSEPLAAVLTETEAELRAFFLQRLRSRQSAERQRYCALLLLRHPEVTVHLLLSPAFVLRTFALSFRSSSGTATGAPPTSHRLRMACGSAPQRSPRFPSCFFEQCCMLVDDLMRKKQFRDAAYIAWNHLAAPQPSCRRSALAALLRRRPQAFAAAVGAMTTVMRLETSRSPREAPLLSQARPRKPHHVISNHAWMGYRSLDFLKQAGPEWVTPLECILVGAAALDCGVHFAAVNQAVLELCPSCDRGTASVLAQPRGAAGSARKERPLPATSTAEWAINMVRLLAESQTVVKLLPLRQGISGSGRWGGYQLTRPTSPPSRHHHLQQMMSTLYHQSPRSALHPGYVEVSLPNRSRSLAIWQLLHGQSRSRSAVLSLLLCRLALERGARDAFFGPPQSVVESHTSTASHNGLQDELNAFFMREVLASLAAGCTDDEILHHMLRSIGTAGSALLHASEERDRAIPATDDDESDVADADRSTGFTHQGLSMDYRDRVAFHWLNDSTDDDCAAVVSATATSPSAVSQVGG